MSLALYVPVTESLKELRIKLKQAPPMLQPRLKMLLVMKRVGESGISKRELMDSVGVCSQSIQNWRTAYKRGGMEGLLSNGKKGKCGRSSIFTKKEHRKIEALLHNPRNGLSGYVELQKWVADEFQKEVKYNTVLKYATRHFGSKVKTARKSHVKKDEEAVGTFKKTFVEK
jgi:transposase